MTFLLRVLAGLAVAVVAHELTHYAAARAFGREAVVSWRTLETYHGVPGGVPTVEDRLIGAAPWIVGLVLVGVLVAVGVAVPVEGWFALALYTTGGGFDDLTVDVIDRRAERPNGDE